jgi:hypothetical protein
MAVAQTDQLGDDETSNLKRSDVYAAAADLMIDSNRPVAAMKAMRQSIASLNRAMQQSNLPGRYRKRRSEPQRKTRSFADQSGMAEQDALTDRPNPRPAVRRNGLVMDKRRVELRAVKPVLRPAQNLP